MMIKSWWIWIGLMALGLPAGGAAQAPAPTTREGVRPIGVVTAIDGAGKQITIKTDAGADMIVRLQEGTTFLRVPPGEKDLKNAVKIDFSDIGVGDRILARGRVADDQKSIPATSVIVMTKADIAKKHEADRAEWQKRGVAGIITATNPDTKELTISTRTAGGTKPLVITLASNAGMRRYAPDSVKFSEAKPSTFADLKVGDQVRALGSKSEDGSRFTAEELVSGSFRNLAGTVVAVDTKENTLKITDLTTKKPLLVRISPDSNLRKLPPYAAQMLARGNAGGAPRKDGDGGESDRAGASGPPASDRPRGPRPDGGRGPGGPGGGRGPGGMMGRDGAFDIQQMLERMPTVTLADLKPGDALIVASTTGADAAQVTAITLLAGVEPLLTAPSPGGQPMVLGAWSLEMNMNLP